MAGIRVEIKDIVVDSVDPERQASFWAELLGREVAARTGPYVWLTRGNGPGIGFQQVAGPKTAKNRVHFDIASEDPPATQARAEALGGRRLEQYAEGGFLVMADPEGNEFCVITPEPFDIDDDGHADYLEPRGADG